MEKNEGMIESRPNKPLLFAMAVAFVIAISIILSLLARVPYMYTVCGFAAWAAIGHLVTLDDDASGGWSNPDNSKEVWRKSRRELILKFVVLFALLAITFSVPSLNNWGA